MLGSRWFEKEKERGRGMFRFRMMGNDCNALIKISVFLLDGEVLVVGSGGTFTY